MLFNNFVRYKQSSNVFNNFRLVADQLTHSSFNSARQYHRRRVVVTGLGLICPLGIGVQTSWNNLIENKSGLSHVKDGDRFKDIPCKIAGYVPEIDQHLEKSFNKSQLRTFSRSALYTLLAAKELFDDAQWKPTSDEESYRSGVAIGSGMVDFDEIISANDKFRNEGYNRVTPHFITKILLNLPAGYVSMEYGLKGPNHTVSTACTTGAHAVGDAFNFIRNNVADTMICGGVEAAINPLSFVSFCRIRALCTKYNDNPTSASRPFDKDRNGFVMGEGAALILLEELEHAKKRNSKIYGEILGYGLSADANHITAPREDGEGAKNCITNAIKDANLSLNQIGHINCHATSTPIGDQIEFNAIKELFRSTDYQNIIITSTKGSTGHLLGAAGSTEAIFALLACSNRKIPPTLNLKNPLDTEIDIIANQCQPWKNSSNQKRIALTNSFGFGGTNASIAISEFVE